MRNRIFLRPRRRSWHSPPALSFRNSLPFRDSFATSMRERTGLREEPIMLAVSPAREILRESRVARGHDTKAPIIHGQGRSESLLLSLSVSLNIHFARKGKRYDFIYDDSERGKCSRAFTGSADQRSSFRSSLHTHTPLCISMQPLLRAQVSLAGRCSND